METFARQSLCGCNFVQVLLIKGNNLVAMACVPYHSYKVSNLRIVSNYRSFLNFEGMHGQDLRRGKC